jgi:hypothetical protein
MANFEKRESPDTHKIAYEITDDFGHTAQLSAQQAYDLRSWLDGQYDKLFREARGYLSFEESQRQRLCPYCGSPGERYHDPVLDLDQDLYAYRCTKEQHTYFVEKRFFDESEQSP